MESPSVSCLRIPYKQDEEVVFEEIFLLPSDYTATPILLSSNEFPSLTAWSIPAKASQGHFPPNIRATALAFGAGLHSARFFGEVLLCRPQGAESLRHTQLSFSPDLRGVDEVEAWQLEAARINFGFKSAMGAMQRAFTGEHVVVGEGGGDEMGFEVEESETESESEGESGSCSGDDGDCEKVKLGMVKERPFVKQSLCFACRRPCDTTCQKCGAVYLHSDCTALGWSHEVTCSLWRSYCDERSFLSSFEGIEWTKVTTSNSFTRSEEPYRQFLESLGLLGKNWWSTEVAGWAGGLSGSAKTVDCTKRVDFKEGLGTDIIGSIGVPITETETKELSNWAEYLNYRGIPTDSHLPLLLHFPVTLYHLVVEHCRAQLIVAQMTNKPLTIHYVGTEKELNFLDIYGEFFALLAPYGVAIELVFIVRRDMLPPLSEKTTFAVDEYNHIHVIPGEYITELDPNFDCVHPPSLIVALNAGEWKEFVRDTFHESGTLLVLTHTFALFAGFYAYDTWVPVVDFIVNSKTTAVCTDYNAWSGLNCASLGGSKARNSLSINPFRQPLALPVYSMNLPQFANGWKYVFNEQEVE